MFHVTIHFEVYIVDANGVIQVVLRRSEYEMPPPNPDIPYIFYDKGKTKWTFPHQGMHFDMLIDAYVVWAQFNQPVNLENYGFLPLERERWR